MGLNAVFTAVVIIFVKEWYRMKRLGRFLSKQHKI